jgi:subtilase family serine protease
MYPLFAGDGVWAHYYVVCFSDRRNGGKPCTGAPSTWVGAGGTSFGSPIMAGLQALIDQKYGRQGNPAPSYYAVATQHPSNYCNSDSSGIGAGCIFYDITLGDNIQPCSGTNSCYGSSSTTNGGGGFGFGGRGHDARGPGRGETTIYGVLSTSDTAPSYAYASGTGWDFATGIGSVNAYNVFTNWVAAPTQTAAIK